MFDQQLANEIDEAIAEVREGRRALAEQLVAMNAFNAGLTPFRMHKGTGVAWNFTLGPAFIYEGPRSIDTLNFLPMPVVVLASYIPEAELHKIDRTRCYGFVFEQASVIDPSFWWMHDENRAAVVGCPGVLADAKAGEDVVVDGVRGRVYLTPDADTRNNYVRLRGLGPPQKDQVFWDALRRFAMLLIGSRKARKLEPPYEFAEQQRLIDLTRRARLGETLGPEDHEWMQGLLLEGMPSPEEVMARAKELEKSSKGARKPARAGGRDDPGAKDDEAATKGGRGRREPPSTGRGGAADEPAAKPDRGKAADAETAGPAGSAGAAEAAKADPLAGLTGAALRRAQREQEMEEARKRRQS